MSSNVINFPDTSKPKTLSARDRMEALLMAQRNRSVIEEFPDLIPGAKTLLELNAQLLMRIAE